ncbi:MAG: hypothetical protein V3W18_03085 [candidate division Zixibacteria bacterium]
MLPRQWKLLVVCIGLFIACGSEDESSINKKRMPDLQYVYSSTESDDNIELSVSGTFDLYGTDPRVFSDPIGIIYSFDDSIGFKPAGRRFGLILSDPNWYSKDTLILKDTIPGGPALSLIFNGRYRGLDSCWSEIYEYAESKGYEYILPGIEVYRGHGAESLAVATELIIRIK